ncbi:NADH dehydrogenase [ubiquinone] 1 beta subcomplex subunit 9-like [Crassostrea virginica]|uniref:NADH dehydrogenase [ubiquinone] 1 beta subcomplex subunit 9 n=1 Tax=Crassostrea virginica TaxID=6565 RepID=A0A8B8EDC8_CRAVI|nr:NADH dehydrogenase [ubiquinone] 1 beta subcomplex subunit 9-like [Crassostrea virginica]
MTTVSNLAATKIPRHLQFKYLSHGQRVLRYYKKQCRHLERVSETRLMGRMAQVELRAHIDAHKDEKDYLKATKMLEDAEAVLLTKWLFPVFNFSPGGTCYGRYVYFPDYIIDSWHPLEKAMYPKYFATREIRKLEYILWWQKKYGTEALGEDGSLEKKVDKFT